MKRMKSNDETMSALQAERQKLEKDMSNKNSIIGDLERKVKALEENLGKQRDEKEAEMEKLRKDSSIMMEDILSLKREI